MATTRPTSASEAANDLDAPNSLVQEIRDFWQQFFVAAFSPYRPEQHYMRGPGPACAAKRGRGADRH
jgi:hypothetical protein